MSSNIVLPSPFEATPKSTHEDLSGKAGGMYLPLMTFKRSLVLTGRLAALKLACVRTVLSHVTSTKGQHFASRVPIGL